MPQAPRIALGLLCAAVCVACNLSAPVLTGILFESLSQGGGPEGYRRALAMLVGVYTVEPILTQVYIRTMVAAGENAIATLRRKLFRAVLHQEVAFFDLGSSSELTGLLSTQLGTVRDVIVGNVSRDRGIRALLETIGSCAVLVWLSAKLAPVQSAAVLSLSVFAALYSRWTKALFAKDALAVRRMNDVAGEAFDNIKTVRSFAGESQEEKRFGDLVDSSLESGLGIGRAKSFLEALNRTAIHASLILLFGYGGFLVADGQISLRVLLSGIGFTFSLVFATQGLVNTLADARRAVSAIASIHKTLENADPEAARQGEDYAPDFDAGVPAIVAKPSGGVEAVPSATAREEDRTSARELATSSDLVLSGVSFAYPARPSVRVLKHIDLRLRAGTVTALVGRSGSGKSTVASMIARFYEPTSGEVTLGGVSAGQFPREDWANAVSLVSQEPVLFSGTVRENIAYGGGRDGQGGAAASDEDVEAAAWAANAAEFISELPDGFDTQVGPRGAQLSGGQRQRIAIARALVKDAPILVLDEATSALDSVSERLVQEALERLMAGRTVVVIAHRLSTVQRADSIAVMSGGRVIEQGTHAELIAQRGAYADLVDTQRLAFND
ncbi:unnamed protein product [Pedinophyceae sp. YPF-701]|nr:unnamed protein product [Pedinophyceae sp. YPF-701]